MLFPKKTKFRKLFKAKASDRPKERGSFIAFGEYGLKALGSARITSRQIEAARKTMSRSLKRKGKLIIRIFPDKPITKKPAETRMGGGKGNVEEWCELINPGRILFEVSGVNKEDCAHAFELASAKLPVATKLVSREGRGEL